MMENLIDDGTYIECTGKFDLVNPPINCWNKSGHGSLEIRGAIEQSCNYYFNMIGFEAGKNEKDEFSENLSLSKLQKYAEEFGLDENGNVILGDEMLTPDSSRFWPAEGYEPGHGQPSFDKQFARDWLKANPDND